MKKPIYLILLIAIVSGLSWYAIEQFNAPIKPAEMIQPGAKQEVVTEEIKPLEFAEEQLESYYSSYINPYVTHARKALDGYLDGSNYGMGVPELVIDPEQKTDKVIYGLGSFDKDYYQGKFIVYIINDSIAGGKEISIIFQDKPDKLFTAWVYKFSGEEGYDLKGFWQDLSFDEKKMAEIRQLYKNQLEDREYAI